MPCRLCGDVCECAPNRELAPVTRWVPEPDPPTPAPVNAAKLEAGNALEFDDQSASSAERVLASLATESVEEDSSAWRRELAVRLNRYQSKRKPRPPRYPSLRLKFEEEDRTRGTPAHPEGFPLAETMPPISSEALAIDHFAQRFAADDEPATPTAASEEARETSAIIGSPTAKVLEFPRSWIPPLPPVDELAEPVMTRPRILEAPEVVPPPPALGGITIEPAHQPVLEKRPGIDTPLQPAPLGRRFLAAVIDGVVISAACGLFAFIFWKLTALRPPRLEIFGFLVGLSATFWAAYQFLLVTYAGTTPGLRLAELELARFDGTPASRRLRRWRVLASFLSALSLGMGYGWVLLDEDSLCWHDRITRTHLARLPRKQNQPTATLEG
jgi:uncharacterized RDD family membrane protein YckC